MRPMLKNFSRRRLRSASTLAMLRGRNDENHTDTKIEGLEETVRIHFADLGKVFEDGEHGPGGEIHDGF